MSTSGQYDFTAVRSRNSIKFRNLSRNLIKYQGIQSNIKEFNQISRNSIKYRGIQSNIKEFLSFSIKVLSFSIKFLSFSIKFLSFSIKFLSFSFKFLSFAMKFNCSSPERERESQEIFPKYFYKFLEKILVPQAFNIFLLQFSFKNCFKILLKNRKCLLQQYFFFNKFVGIFIEKVIGNC